MLCICLRDAVTVATVSLTSLSLLSSVPGQDPRTTRFDDGGAITQFSLATSNAVRTREGGYEAKTDWFNITCRQPQLVDTIERIIKRGQTLYVEGPIEVRDFVDKDGVERRNWSVKILNNASFRILKWPQNQEPPASGMGGGNGSHNNSGAARNDRNVFGSDRDVGQIYE